MKSGFFKPIHTTLLLGLIIGFTANTAMGQEKDNSEGEPEVTIIKYSDYQCPACQHFHQFEKKLKSELGDKVKIVTKHFPLRMHRYAQLASRAVEAAREQEKYEEMHNLIFDGQEQWARGNAHATFLGYARQLDLDIEQFRKDMNSAEMQRRIMADRREGLNKNVNSTPTFFINGEKLENNPPTYEAFKNKVMSYME